MARASDLQRFVEAQDEGGTYARALAELRRGRKTSHWMWFVFPQVAGLGTSEMSRRYAIANAAEARAYLRHQVLGPRLRECASALLDGAGSAAAILGGIDAQKLQSSMTLFGRVDPAGAIWAQVLERYFGGAEDAATVRILGADPAS